MRPIEGHPAINYPCRWPYRIICTDESELRAAIVVIVGTAEHTVAPVGEGTSGRYRRFELVVQVCDERHRNAIFAALTRLPSVYFVL